MSATTTDTARAVPYQASRRTLGRASLAALGAGAAIVLLFVMPAEYGIDPTGVGGALGLTRMSGEQAEAAEDSTPATPADAAPVALRPQTKATIDKLTPMRSDERKLTIAPHEGIELKARMKAGDALVFRWTATGPLKMDMHGEPGPPSTDFSTYWKEKGLTTAQGDFTAPFAGIHGWYWRNQGETPVTLTLNTTGFYAELFRPAE
ncbi:hypothetical protein [Sphingomonas solaris]|uniref:Transmembrane anchor protein n=1 Tax=Alterirhizorhabdus solaris TaxID=2529389 RepID=A0A558R5F9_9SPHN|nr:hypothetical protein [Sphingomonas solaris]TVV74588.1 hypothetical protein FOY91_09460 [Sphingomonas solaris]